MLSIVFLPDPRNVVPEFLHSIYDVRLQPFNGNRPSEQDVIYVNQDVFIYYNVN